MKAESFALLNLDCFGRGCSQNNIMCAIGITFQIHLLISDQLQHLLSLRHSDDEGNMM